MPAGPHATNAPILAGTLILVHDGSPAPEVLMVERASEMAFAAGATVFPGGRVDFRDHLLGRSPDGAARVAAIRETLEETGVAVAIDPPPAAATADALRAGLAGGLDFDMLLNEAGLTLDLDALTPYARWLPNLRETRIFDTLFYVARAPRRAKPLADGQECVAAGWITAQSALAAGRLIFPTRRNLERLARFASFAEIVADAARWPVETITPWTEERDGEQWLCIPDDRGYPVTAQRMSEVRRG